MPSNKLKIYEKSRKNKLKLKQDVLNWKEETVNVLSTVIGRIKKELLTHWLSVLQRREKSKEPKINKKLLSRNKDRYFRRGRLNPRPKGTFSKGKGYK